MLGSDWLWGCRGRKPVVAPEVLAEVVALSEMGTQKEEQA